jgi:hypothetical protein
MPHSFGGLQLQSIKQLGARPLQSIKQLGVRPLQSIKQFGVCARQSIKQFGCVHCNTSSNSGAHASINQALLPYTHSHQQTICPGPRVNRRIAQPGTCDDVRTHAQQQRLFSIFRIENFWCCWGRLALKEIQTYKIQ